jgi:hypothetical protein
MTPTNTTTADAGANIDEMDLAAVERELRGYSPGTAVEVVELEEHRARRQALWRRLDKLSGVRRPAAGAAQRGE